MPRTSCTGWTSASASFRIRNPAPKNPRRISKRVALLLLAHSAGHIHQPLHVGCGYIDAHGRFVDPAREEREMGEVILLTSTARLRFMDSGTRPR